VAIGWRWRGQAEARKVTGSDPYIAALEAGIAAWARKWSAPGNRVTAGGPVASYGRAAVTIADASGETKVAILLIPPAELNAHLIWPGLGARAEGMAIAICPETGRTRVDVKTAFGRRTDDVMATGQIQLPMSVTNVSALISASDRAEWMARMRAECERTPSAGKLTPADLLAWARARSERQLAA
jgi:hypothetical protein